MRSKVSLSRLLQDQDIQFSSNTSSQRQVLDHCLASSRDVSRHLITSVMEFFLLESDNVNKNRGTSPNGLTLFSKDRDLKEVMARVPRTVKLLPIQRH